MKRKSKSSSSPSSSPFPSGPDPVKEREYRDEDDHRTMTRAAEIQNDRARMSGVRRHQKKATRNLSKVGRMIGGGKMMGGGRS